MQLHLCTNMHHRICTCVYRIFQTAYIQSKFVPLARTPFARIFDHAFQEAYFRTSTGQYIDQHLNTFQYQCPTIMSSVCLSHSDGDAGSADQ